MLDQQYLRRRTLFINHDCHGPHHPMPGEQSLQKSRQPWWKSSPYGKSNPVDSGVPFNETGEPGKHLLLFLCPGFFENAADCAGVNFFTPSYAPVPDAHPTRACKWKDSLSVYVRPGQGRCVTANARMSARSASGGTKAVAHKKNGDPEVAANAFTLEREMACYLYFTLCTTILPPLIGCSSPLS